MFKAFSKPLSIPSNNHHFCPDFPSFPSLIPLKKEKKENKEKKGGFVLRKGERGGGFFRL